MTIKTSVAAEHLSDGKDNIAECLKTIKRVEKSFPHLADSLAKASACLSGARTALCEAESQLLPPPEKF